MNKFIKVALGSVAAVSMAGLGLWFGTEIDMINAMPIFDYVNASKETIMQAGLAGTINTVGYFTIKSMVDRKNSAAIKKMTIMNHEVIEGLHRIETQNDLVIKYNALRADMTMQGRVATDEEKSKLQSWMSSMEPGTLEKLLDYIPEEVKDDAKELVLDKADDVIDIIKKLV